MFRGVGEGFRCHVVRGDLDRFREPPFDRDVRARREPESGGRVFAARGRARFGRGSRGECRVRSLGVRSWRRRVRPRSRDSSERSSSDRQEHRPRQHVPPARVQRVAAACRRGDCARCGGGLRPTRRRCGGVTRRARTCSQCSRSPSQGARVNVASRTSVSSGNGLPTSASRQRTPEMALDDDRAPDRRRDSPPPARRRRSGRWQPRSRRYERTGPSGAPSTQRSCPRSATVLPTGKAAASVVLHEATEVTRAVRFEATHRGAFDGEQAADLLRDGPEEILRRCPLCHQRCDPAQSSLLDGECPNGLA